MNATKTPTPVLPNITDCEWTPSVAHLFRRHYLIQSPMYVFRWIYAVFYSLYLLFVIKPPTDADIVRGVENTSLCMLIRPARNCRSDEYEITIDDCKLRATGGFQLKNMSMRYKKGKENGVQIQRFTRNGKEVINRSRQALRNVMKCHGIDQRLLEALFNHIVVHAMDHHGAVESSHHLKFSLHPWDTGCTIDQAFITNMFILLVVRPNLNPLAPNTIRSINKPFYQDLYRELKKIDPDVAEVVTASVIF
ncbi:Hypp4028 [Branchiostoma lanceolatum]|uniref:Hypp4028 protein n=1 Tax=Branchiostoma lanceolatum TaxID=7740 RepID=A0A8K0A454_BRALA|nr:Hypp4028 [Branchiostoma lanceolatum]